MAKIPTKRLDEIFPPLCLDAFQTLAGDYAKGNVVTSSLHDQIKRRVLEPFWDQITQHSGQINDKSYLAFMLEYVLNQMGPPP